MDSITALPWGLKPSGIPEVPSGHKLPVSSPPLQQIVASGLASGWSGTSWRQQRGEAARTITGECERLFCGTLSALFLGEGNLARQESLGMGALETLGPKYSRHEYPSIRKWIEVWDYAGDAIYRGFVASMDNERTMFVFLGESELGHDLKSGLIALFELASTTNFDCSQIVLCVPRSQDRCELECARNLGWCGFNLTTLEPWIPPGSYRCTTSKRWLFLSAEV